MRVAGLRIEPVTPEYIERVINAFILHGQNFSAVSRVLNVSAPTAKRFWQIGWPKLGIPPIKEEYYKRSKKPFSPFYPSLTTEIILNGAKPEDENGPVRHERDAAQQLPVTTSSPAHLQTRIMAQHEIDARVHHAVNLVKAQVAAALESEFKMVQGARNNVIGMNAVANKGLVSANYIFDKLTDTMNTELAGGKLSAMDMVKILAQLAKAMNTIAYASSLVTQTQRLIVGMPANIMEHRTPPPPVPGTQTGDPVDDMSAKLIATLSKAAGARAAATAVGEYTGEESHGLDEATRPDPLPRSPAPSDPAKDMMLSGGGPSSDADHDD